MRSIKEICTETCYFLLDSKNNLDIALEKDVISFHKTDVIERFALETLLGGAIGGSLGVVLAVVTGGLAAPIIPKSAIIGVGMGASIFGFTSSMIQVLLYQINKIVQFAALQKAAKVCDVLKSYFKHLNLNDPINEKILFLNSPHQLAIKKIIIENSSLSLFYENDNLEDEINKLNLSDSEKKELPTMLFSFWIDYIGKMNSERNQSLAHINIEPPKSVDKFFKFLSIIRKNNKINECGIDRVLRRLHLFKLNDYVKDKLSSFKADVY